MSPLLIFPCNGNAIEALDCLDGSGYELLGFVDDSTAKQATAAYGHAVHARSAFARWPEAKVLAVPGRADNYAARKGVIEALALDAARFASLVHRTARISPLASIGRNVLILAGVVITSNAVIGDHVCLLPNTVIHHDVLIGAWTLVGSNVTVAGHTTIGEGCYVGSGASLMHGLTVGDGALVGFGSNVIRSVEPGARVAGNPARRLV